MPWWVSIPGRAWSRASCRPGLARRPRGGGLSRSPSWRRMRSMTSSLCADRSPPFLPHPCSEPSMTAMSLMSPRAPMWHGARRRGRGRGSAQRRGPRGTRAAHRAPGAHGRRQPPGVSRRSIRQADRPALGAWLRFREVDPPFRGGSTALFRCRTSLFRCRTSLFRCRTALFRCRTALFRCRTALFRCRTALFRCPIELLTPDEQAAPPAGRSGPGRAHSSQPRLDRVGELGHHRLDGLVGRKGSRGASGCADPRWTKARR